jgi:acetyl-CoA acetyltransferase
VITTTERARDLPKKPVLVHACVHGQTDRADEEQTYGIHQTGQNVVVPALFARSDLQLHDFDIYFPYDGFSIICLLWFENVGYCGKGEAGDFLRANWDAKENRIKLNGKIPINTHGGSLSEGGTQGTGHLREAVQQLRGECGARQAPGVKNALLTPGGIFFNSQGIILRTE